MNFGNTGCDNYLDMESEVEEPVEESSETVVPGTLGSKRTVIREVTLS